MSHGGGKRKSWKKITERRRDAEVSQRRKRRKKLNTEVTEEAQRTQSGNRT
jgi:hypothetical protein